MASVKNQVLMALQEINGIRTDDKKESIPTKYEFRQNNSNEEIQPIFSIKYFKETLETSVAFGDFCKSNFGIKNIFDIQPNHYKTFLNDLENRDCSVGHLINTESHLIKFQDGMEKFSNRTDINRDFAPFVEKRMYSSSEREQPNDRSYSEKEIELILKNVSPAVRSAIELSLNVGLRMRETTKVRKEFFVESNNGLKLEIQKGHGKSITKGGRHRMVPITKEYENKLRSLINNKENKQKIIDIKEGTIRSALSRACKKLGIKSKGFHGFRHTWARNRLQDLLGNKKEVGKDLIKKMLENRRQHTKIDKGLELHPDLPYLKKVINQVLSELGHGQSRWGLMAVYLSFE